MHSTSLREFVSHARQAGRIRFGDLRRLQRDILPARLTTREEAEALIALDRAVTRADPDWSNYLVGTVRDFVVWGLAPVGLIDRDKAEWLGSVLSSGGISKTARMIAREVVREACAVDEVLVAFGGRKPRRHSRESLRPENAAMSSAPNDAVSDLYSAPPDGTFDQGHRVFHLQIEEALRGLDGIHGRKNQFAVEADLEGREVSGRNGINPDHRTWTVPESSELTYSRSIPPTLNNALLTVSPP